MTIWLLHIPPTILEMIVFNLTFPQPQVASLSCSAADSQHYSLPHLHDAPHLVQYIRWGMFVCGSSSDAMHLCIPIQHAIFSINRFIGLTLSESSRQSETTSIAARSFLLPCSFPQLYCSSSRDTEQHCHTTVKHDPSGFHLLLRHP